MATTLDERFELEERIGAGAMGVVYRARDRRTGGVVAVKLLELVEGSALPRFEREARLLAGIQHPAVVRHVAHGVGAEGQRYLAMEWMEGLDLRQRLELGVLSVADTLALAARVADGLAAAHDLGVVHRDVKPSNVFLVGKQPTEAKLLDFGVARVAGESGALTRQGTVIGTPAYMAPEQVRGELDVDGRADLFALGATIFECLAGRPPFVARQSVAVMAKIVLEDAPRLATFRSEVPAGLDALVAALLARRASSRPADARQVAVLLRALADGRTLPAISAPSDFGLTQQENRLVCVVLLLPQALAPVGTDLPTIADASEITTGQQLAIEAQLADIARRHGARHERLLEGPFASLLVASDDNASDLGARGARYALALREQVPDARLAVAVTPAAGTSAVSLGSVIERVAALAAAPVPAVGAGIRLDEACAGLLPADFLVQRDAHGAFLVGRASDSGQRRLLGKLTPFVGRQRELLAAREELLAWSAAGRARALLVSGVAGIGKSRFLAELLGSDALAGVARFAARGNALQEDLPYGLLAAALRQAAGIADSTDPTSARLRLAELAAPVAAAKRSRVVEFLGVLVGLPPAAEESPQLLAARSSPVLLGDQVQRAWQELVRARARRAPLLLVFEDLHWADAPTIKLVDTALRAAADLPLLVIAVARPDLDGRFPELFAGLEPTRIGLTDLSRRAAAELAQAALGERATPEVVLGIVERGGGNAFYLEELIRAAAEGKGDELPSSLVAMTLARLERLEPADRQLLRAGSVFGESFTGAGVARLLRRDEAELGAPLAALEQKEWLLAARGEPGEPRYSFRHALLREAAYASLTPTDRRLGHLLAAEWLEEHGGRDPAALARHFEQGGERGRAVPWYLVASEAALAASDLRGALAQVDASVRCGALGITLGRARLVEASANHWLAQHREHYHAALAALRLLRPLSPAWYRAVDAVAEASLPVGEIDTLSALAQVVAPVPRELDARGGTQNEFLSAAATLAMQLLLAGRLDDGELVLQRLERVVASAPDLPALVFARVAFARATGMMIRGDLGAVVEHARAAVAAFDAAGDLRSAVLMQSNLAWTLAELGAYREAEAPMREVVATAERLGLAFVLATTQQNLAMVLARTGRLTEARATADRLVAAGHAADSLRITGMTRIYLGKILTLAGELDAAEREDRRAAAGLEALPPTLCHALACLARVLLDRGQLGEAMTLGEEAMRIFRELGSIDEGEAMVRLTYAEVLHANGRVDEARQTIAEARAAIEHRAERIGDARWRDSFLTSVPENARTIELAASWGVAGKTLS